jgi:hypothetical protein
MPMHNLLPIVVGCGVFTIGCVTVLAVSDGRLDGRDNALSKIKVVASHSMAPVKFLALHPRGGGCPPGAARRSLPFMI